MFLGVFLSWLLVLVSGVPGFPFSSSFQPGSNPAPPAPLYEFVEIHDDAIVSVPQTVSSFRNVQQVKGTKTRLYQDPVFADVYFDEHRTGIQGSLKNFLQNTVMLLDQEKAWSLRIEGHCDSRGTSAYNLAWSEHHLTTLTQYLTIMGISSERIHRVNFGQDPRLCDSASERCQEDNLRARHIFSTLAIGRSQRGCLIRLRFEAGPEWDRARGYSKQVPYLQRIQVATPAFSSSF